MFGWVRLGKVLNSNSFSYRVHSIVAEPALVDELAASLGLDVNGDHVVRSLANQLKVTSYKLQVTSYKLQVTSYKLQVTYYKLHVTSYMLQVTYYKLQVISYNLQRNVKSNNVMIKVTSYK